MNKDKHKKDENISKSCIDFINNVSKKNEIDDYNPETFENNLQDKIEKFFIYRSTKNKKFINLSFKETIKIFLFVSIQKTKTFYCLKKQKKSFREIRCYILFKYSI